MKTGETAMWAWKCRRCSRLTLTSDDTPPVSCVAVGCPGTDFDPVPLRKGLL